LGLFFPSKSRNAEPGHNLNRSVGMAAAGRIAPITRAATIQQGSCQGLLLDARGRAKAIG